MIVWFKENAFNNLVSNKKVIIVAVVARVNIV